MEVSEAKRLRQLVVENRRLKHMVTDQALDIQALKAVLEKNSKAHTNLLVSEDDPLFSLATYQKFNQEQKFAQFHSIPQGGHLLPLSQPQVVFELLNGWTAFQTQKAANE